MGTIALITDFGSADWFTGEIKAAILSRASSAAIVDITHGIAPGDIRMAAFSLLACYRTFPEDTVFCVVVDPGVGGNRAAIAVQTGRFFFVGPDNGVLSWALRKKESVRVRRIESPDFMRLPLSATFHGRDIFAPAAAALSEKADFSLIGPVIDNCVELPWPAVRVDKNRMTGSIMYIDRFGNALTSIEKDILAQLPAVPLKIVISKKSVELPLVSFYEEVLPCQGLGYIGSSGYLEIAINGANAAAVYDLRVGDIVEVC
ncbi:MAG: SAM-dependent chlorinase/fluorinase [Chitinispirillaceae bacterium]|jgi:hypothetical protein|nr:SAM-dependent chlorinase/fluorinase [Chitinispirillaceae bacterium]